MKRIVLVLAASILLSAAAFAQAPPENSNPAPPNDALWNRVMALPRGQPIMVVNTYGPPLHCEFAGATNDFLFCDPPAAPPDTGYRFERASVLDVTVQRRQVIRHPGVLISAAVAGIALGLGSTRTLNDRDAATVGLISALVAGSAGLAMSQAPRPGLALGFAYQPRGFGFRAGPILHHFSLPHR